MTCNATLLPSNRTFLVNAADTLLEAALRAGLSINYGCSSGNCGLCKAKLISGEIEKVRQQDYVLPEAEKNQGCFLLCSHTAKSDVTIEAGLAGHPDDIQFQDIDARVKTIKLLTDKVMLLHLQTPRSNRLRFLAGQSVALSIADTASDYAVASCPCDDRNLQFHVRYFEDNAFAKKVFNGLRVGETVEVYGPVGDFVLQQESARPVLFLACNSGFAPIKSLIEHAMSLERAPALHLYWLATVEGGHYMSNVCRSWADALDNFYYRELTAASLQEPNPEQVWQKLLDDKLDLRAFDVYVSGPRRFVSKMRQALILAGVASPNLFSTVA